MSRNSFFQTMFLVVGGAFLAFSMVLAGVAGGGNAALAQVQQATKTIQAKGTPVSCASGVYHFVITQVTDTPRPDSITVTWSDNTTTPVNVNPNKTSPTAFYDATAPSSGVTVVSASAVIDSSWSGEFNFSSCENVNATATPTPTKTNTPTSNTPSTPTSTATATKTNTPTSHASSTPTSTATPTKTNTPTSNAPSAPTNTATPTNTPKPGQPSGPGATATPTNTNTPVPSSPNQPSAATNTPVVTPPTTVAGAQATPFPTQTTQPTAVAGVSVTAQTLPKSGDPLAGLLRVLGIALIGLGLTTRFLTRQK